MEHHRDKRQVIFALHHTNSHVMLSKDDCEMMPQTSWHRESNLHSQDSISSTVPIYSFRFFFSENRWPDFTHCSTHHCLPFFSQTRIPYALVLHPITAPLNNTIQKTKQLVSRFIPYVSRIMLVYIRSCFPIFPHFFGEIWWTNPHQKPLRCSTDLEARTVLLSPAAAVGQNRRDQDLMEVNQGVGR